MQVLSLGVILYVRMAIFFEKLLLKPDDVTLLAKSTRS